MLFCPNCQMQYGNDANHCEKCHIPLRDSPPQESAFDDSAEGLDLVELAGFANVSEAEMIQELLEQNDIKSILQGEVDPIGIASRAETTKLLVESKDLQQAQEIYNAYFSGDGEAFSSDQEL
jgi:hypothetical protein